VYSAYLETHLATSAASGGKPDRAVVRSWLAGLAMNANTSTAFLRAGGVPVVFVYQMDKLPASDWQAILTEFAAAGLPVRLVGDAPLPTYGSVMWGNHQYNPNFKTPAELDAFNRDRRLSSRAPAVLKGATPALFAATVSPGFDGSRIYGTRFPVIARGANGERYQATWDAAFSEDPDWVLVTSWNEWAEGTSVQPGQLNGDRALRQTTTNSATFRAS
jgi:hypothetical protein